MYKHRIKHLPGDGDDDDPEEDHEEPQLLVGLLHCGEQTLQPRKMAHKLQEHISRISSTYFPRYLEHSQYPHHPDQPQYLPCPPYHHCVLRYQEHHYYQTINNLHLELLHSKGQEIRKNSQQVHNVQRSSHKLELARAAGQAG